MTKKDLLSILAVFLTFLFFISSASAQKEIIGEKIDQYLTTRSEMGNFSGAVLIAKDGKVLIRKGFGFADVEKKIPYTPETQQEVASISKMFTSMAALKLRDQGKLKLDDGICKFLENCPESWRQITIQQLMRHTSGIPDYEEPLGLGTAKYLEFMAKPDASALIVENAKKLPLDFKPGSKFNYSNTAYIVLSYVVQKAANQPFFDFVTRNILRPAGMKHSGVINSNHLPKDLAKGYSAKDIGWEKALAGVPLTDGHLKRVPTISLTSPEGDAWLYSTVDDLYRWSQLMDGNEKFASKDEVAEIFTPGLEGYGYGWFVGKGFDRRRMRHNGGLPGYISDLIKFPDDKITIVVFSNFDRARLSNISRDISAIVLGTPYDMPVRGKVIKLTSEQIGSLIGDYKMADGTLLTIRNEPNFLTANLQGRYTAGLIPLSSTEFYFPLADGKAIFTLDSTGKAKSANMRYSGEDHLAERVNE
ncbi:MAG: serine hydrolase domain-containing protein [Acidobacteriota bacterium]